MRGVILNPYKIYNAGLGALEVRKPGKDEIHDCYYGELVYGTFPGKKENEGLHEWFHG